MTNNHGGWRKGAGRKANKPGYPYAKALSEVAIIYFMAFSLLTGCLLISLVFGS